jgi:hypothetical protein
MQPLRKSEFPRPRDSFRGRGGPGSHERDEEGAAEFETSRLK